MRTGIISVFATVTGEELCLPHLVGEYLFEYLYPHLEPCQIAGVELRKLADASYLNAALEEQKSIESNLTIARNYIFALNPHLQTMPPNFALNEETIW